MRRFKLAWPVVTAAMLLGSFACSSNRPNAGVAVAYVDRGPPRNRVEIRSVAPGSGYVWLPGFYRWAGDGYLWVPGRWEAVALGHRSWSPGRWRHVRQGWYWEDGRWR